MINVNVGVLGHVDSGKTSLCRCLSEVLSTCALDKHRQSQEKGITIDLGFSSFYLRRGGSSSGTTSSGGNRSGSISSGEAGSGEILDGEARDGKSPHGKSRDGDAADAAPANGHPPAEETLQVCLVDCPGHHSLLNCIIMGAEITDVILLLIDITKGIQKQTVECLVLCEVLQRDVVVVLNKVDLVPPEQREKRVSLMKAKMEMVFRSKPGLRALKCYVVGLSADSKGGAPQEGEQQERERQEGERQEGERQERRLQPGTELQPGTQPPPRMQLPHRAGGVGASPPRSENVEQLISLLREVIRVPARRGQSAHGGDGEVGGESGGESGGEDDGENGPVNRTGRLNRLNRPPRRDEFYFLYDHTFDIRGKGRVYTGTVIRGTIRRNCSVSILPMKEKGRVKEIQSFKKKVDEGIKGNRLSLLICNDHTKNTGKKIERGVIVSEPTSICHFSLFICRVKSIQYFGRCVNNAELLSCVIGFATSPCYGYFFRPVRKPTGGEASQGETPLQPPHRKRGERRFDPRGDYLFVRQLGFERGEAASQGGLTSGGGLNSEENPNPERGSQNRPRDDDTFFLAILKKKVYGYEGEKCIFIKNDDNLNCRICLHGTIKEIIDDGYPHPDAPFIIGKKPTLSHFPRFDSFKLLIEKQKVGQIERLQEDNHSLICKNMFNSSSQVAPYMGREVCLVDADGRKDLRDAHVRHVGVIAAPFAKSGKFIARFEDDLSPLRESCRSFLLVLRYCKDALTKRKVFLWGGSLRGEASSVGRTPLRTFAA
ncbi:selenocysteine-specific elongation factor, putative [Plasmodium vivax]|nr:selenocysteine-specific elongation factor, putative [Plasmodium vivax]